MFLGVGHGGLKRTKRTNTEMVLGVGHEGLKRTKRTNTDLSLPEEITSSILSRLPVKTLLRFQSVCKSWRTLISDSHFINCQLNHSRRSPRLAVLTFKNPNPCEHFCLCSYVRGARECNFLMEFQLPSDGMFFMQPFAVDGLILFHSVSKIHVCNPSTRKLTTLPDGSPHKPLTSISTQHVGFGFDASAKKYKVVRIFYRDFNAGTGFCDVGCEVFVLGSQAWRAASDPPHPVSGFHPTAIDGVLYWTVHEAHRKKTAHVLSFDLRSETFGVITGPPCVSEDHAGMRFINTSVGPGGNLGIYIHDFFSMDVYEWKCGAWEKGYTVSFGMLFSAAPSAILHGSTALFSWGGWPNSFTRASTHPVLAEQNGSESYFVGSSHDAEGLRCSAAAMWEESLVPVE